jgi:hypothetical protein
LKLLDQPIECALGILIAYISGYIIYQRFLHPLAKFPGPFLASLTDLWQVYQFITLKQPYTLTKLHEKYGSIVRYAPDKLSITDEEAVRLIYQTGARYMPKTEFYDAYGAAHPNVFGMRDEAVRQSCSHETEPSTNTSPRPTPSDDGTCRTAFPWATSKKWSNIWIQT